MANAFHFLRLLQADGVRIEEDERLHARQLRVVDLDLLHVAYQFVDDARADARYVDVGHGLRVRTVLGEDAVVAQQQHVLQVHGAPRQAQQQVLAGVGAQQRHLVVQLQLDEGRNVLGPFDHQQQLLLHRVAHIVDAGELLVGQVLVGVDVVERGVRLQLRTLYLGLEQRRDAQPAARLVVLAALAPAADAVALILHRLLLHAGLEAFAQATVAALVALVLVHHTISRETT